MSAALVQRTLATLRHMWPTQQDLLKNSTLSWKSYWT